MLCSDEPSPSLRCHWPLTVGGGANAHWCPVNITLRLPDWSEHPRLGEQRGRDTREGDCAWAVCHELSPLQSYWDPQSLDQLINIPSWCNVPGKLITKFGIWIMFLPSQELQQLNVGSFKIVSTFVQCAMEISYIDHTFYVPIRIIYSCV